MRSPEEVLSVQRLLAQGLNASEVSRRLGIPRSTVRDWQAGRIPSGRRHRGNGLPSEVCESCGHVHPFDELPTDGYSYLLGLYLGDGYISAAARGVFRLRITLDARYPGIIRECSEAMAVVMPDNRVLVQRRRSRCVDVGSWSKSWPCLFPQHGPGLKHRRKIVLLPWQDAYRHRAPQDFLRGLFHSDGSRSINTIRHPKKTYVYARYLFSNRSADIRHLFADTCDLLGIEWRQMNRYNLSVAKRDSVARMDAFVGPKR
jgi:hypothetical protein